MIDGWWLMVEYDWIWLMYVNLWFELPDACERKGSVPLINIFWIFLSFLPKAAHLSQATGMGQDGCFFWNWPHGRTLLAKGNHWDRNIKKSFLLWVVLPGVRHMLYSPRPTQRARSCLSCQAPCRSAWIERHTERPWKHTAAWPLCEMGSALFGFGTTQQTNCLRLLLRLPPTVQAGFEHVQQCSTLFNCETKSLQWVEPLVYFKS